MTTNQIQFWHNQETEAQARRSELANSIRQEREFEEKRYQQEQQQAVDLAKETIKAKLPWQTATGLAFTAGAGGVAGANASLHDARNAARTEELNNMFSGGGETYGRRVPQNTKVSNGGFQL